MSLTAKIEAILYLKGQPLSVSELTELAQCERAQVKDALIELMSDYARRDSALEVIETSNGYSLQLRETYSDLMDSLIPPELGVGALRTLAAIALKGGISQTDLVELRGSGAYQQVQELVEMGFVRKRRQPETRSYWLQVTSKFHQYFQLDELPQQLSLSFPDRTLRTETVPDEDEQELVDLEMTPLPEVPAPDQAPLPAPEQSEEMINLLHSETFSESEEEENLVTVEQPAPCVNEERLSHLAGTLSQSPPKSPE